MVERFPGMVLTEERIREYQKAGYWTEETFAEKMERNAREYPDFVHRDEWRTLTYRELWEEAGAVAAKLLELGVRKGDRVALQLPTSLDYVVALYGAVRIGAVGVQLQVDLSRDAVAQSIEKAGARVLVVTENYRGEPTAENARAIRDASPTLEHVIVQGGEDYPKDVLSFEEVRSSGERPPEDVERANRPEALDPFVMVFTSGTTGSPKETLHLHANYIYGDRSYEKLYGHKAGEATLCLAPISHQTGMLVGVNLPVYTGGRMLLMEHFAASRVMRWMEEEKPTYLVGAPPHVIHVANAPRLKEIDTTNARLFIYAGGPVPSPILRRLQEDSGITVSCMFGWTEGLGMSITLPDDPIEAISKTVGRPLPGMEVRLVDDDGNEVPVGEPGEMLCRGPSFCAGYYNNPKAAAERWDSEGWFHSGDLLRKDEEGRYTFMGRADDIINRGGTKIDPKQIEDVLGEHEAIDQAVVVGAPDPTLGQRTVACVILNEGAEEFSLEELHEFLRERGLARFQLPDGLVFMEEFPMTHSGKTKRKDLRQMPLVVEAGSR
ncbi:MAG: acyl--CoA ligase [Rubrobacteraceae bacterium]|nr:acyl--CoA ligase [Rubrobacteraceae bacterium]